MVGSGFDTGVLIGIESGVEWMEGTADGFEKLVR